MIDSISLRRIRFGFFASCPAGQGEKINVQPEPRGVQLNFLWGFFPLKNATFSLKVESKSWCKKALKISSSIVCAHVSDVSSWNPYQARGAESVAATKSWKGGSAKKWKKVSLPSRWAETVRRSDMMHETEKMRRSSCYAAVKTAWVHLNRKY